MNRDFWERLGKLEELAKGATPGPWRLYSDNNTLVMDADGRLITSSNHCMFKIRLSLLDNAKPDDNAAYIAAANPAMVLEMIAELRRLEKENEELWANNYGPEILNDPQALTTCYFAGRMAEGRERKRISCRTR